MIYIYIYIYTCIYIYMYIYTTSNDIISYHAISYKILSYHILSHRIILYHFVSHTYIYIYIYHCHMHDVSYILSLYNIQWVSISFCTAYQQRTSIFTQAWERATTGGRAARGEKGTLALCPKPSHFFWPFNGSKQW